MSNFNLSNMKKYLFLAASLFVGAICLTSCSDDEKGPDFNQLYEQLVNGEIKPTVTFTEEGEKMTLNIEYPDAGNWYK